MTSVARILLPATAVLTVCPFISSGTALVLGVFVSLAVGNPYLEQTRTWTHKLLGISVMGLGAGMDLRVIGRVGLQGVGYTMVGIGLTLLIGTWLGRLMKTERNTSLLITVGTAICGGSAIAALAPTIRAQHHEVSVALGTVFVLNAVALFLFPWMGHAFSLNQTQFGLWSALAIHDTSSVVGATLSYGAQALQVGTTVKLARALWIVPVTLAMGALHSRAAHPLGPPGKAKRPWFILGFLLAAALVTWIPELQPVGQVVDTIAKRLLALTLFLIGTNLTRETLQSVGVKPFIQGASLWALIATGTLGAILIGWIR